MKTGRVIEIDGIDPSLIKREVIVRPGYDCIRNPCGKKGCGTNPGANHGIHCDEWIYVARDASGDCALSLLIFSGVWPESVPTSARFALKMPRGADISFHSAFPTEDGDESRACDWVRGGRCWLHSTGLGGMNFAEEFFVKEHAKDQHEPFWRAMETSLAEWAWSIKKGMN